MRDLLLLVLGFIMLGLGTAFLAIFGEGGFFVFPFFFFGDPGLFPVMVIFSLAIMILFFWWANNQYPEDARFAKYQKPKEDVLRIGSLCKLCGSPMPENAAFCSSCGSQVDFGSNDNDSF